MYATCLSPTGVADAAQLALVSPGPCSAAIDHVGSVDSVIACAAMPSQSGATSGFERSGLLSRRGRRGFFGFGSLVQRAGHRVERVAREDRLRAPGRVRFARSGRWRSNRLSAPDDARLVVEVRARDELHDTRRLEVRSDRDEREHDRREKSLEECVEGHAFARRSKRDTCQRSKAKTSVILVAYNTAMVGARRQAGKPRAGQTLRATNWQDRRPRQGWRRRSLDRRAVSLPTSPSFR